MFCMRRIRVNAAPGLIITFSLLIIPSIALSIINNYSGAYKFVYGQPDQKNFNFTNSPNIQNIPIKKIQV
jgi:hypothetical protein